MARAAPALGIPALACVINQDAAHHLRGDGEELSPVLPAGAPLVHQLQVRFVQKRRRLQRVVGPFPPHVKVRKPAQFFMDHGHQLVECRFIPVAPIDQELGDFP